MELSCPRKRLEGMTLAAAIGKTIGAVLQPAPSASVHGGSINRSYRWESSVGPLFIKIAPASGRCMLEAEAAGLTALAHAGSIRVPHVLGVGGASPDLPPGVFDEEAQLQTAWLALVWIQFAPPSSESAGRLGEQLALLHHNSAQAFGWNLDNTIGSTFQPNMWSYDWASFFRERRLRFQLELARENGYSGRLLQRGASLLEHVPEFFSDYHPVASLLHGDLWGRNWATDEMGAPVIFDPAVYYGDREADIAMTRLFGGFPREFYAAYENAWPLDDDAPTRVVLYNLYHVLNHLNLFGRSYLYQAESYIDQLLAELGH
jgi:protein-ribulosamine 3-kinase